MNESNFVPVNVVYPMQLTKDIDVYREPGDDKHIVRFNIPTIDSAIRVGKNVQVAGVTFRKDEANAFAFGFHQWCSLEFEPSNKYDKNAIKVIGYWDGNEVGDEPRHGHIGYVPKEKAKLWVGKKLLAKMRTIFMPINGRTVGIRIDIWEPDTGFIAALDDNQKNVDLAVEMEQSATPVYIPPPPSNFEEDWLDEGGDYTPAQEPF